jgi:PEP-CTERM motif
MWFRKVTTLMYGALALCTSLAEAAPVKYDLDKPFAHASSPGGWFIFDRDTATFGGYSITFDDYGAPDYLAPTFDSPTILSTSVDGFTFSDNMTMFAQGQNFDVHLGAFGTFPPAEIVFDNIVRGPDSTGNYLLIGHINMPIWYESEKGGAIEVGAGYFYVDPFQQIAAIPEPETYAMLLAGLGLLGFEVKRRRKAIIA